MIGFGFGLKFGGSGVSGLKTIMDIFSTIPELISGVLKFKDKTTNANDCQVLGGGLKNTALTGISLLNVIPYSWATDGTKFEFIFRLNGTTDGALGEDSGEGSLRILNGYFYIYFPTSVSPYYLAKYITHTFTTGTHYLLGIETASSVVKVKVTTPNDPNYLSATIYNIPLSEVANLIETTSWATLFTGRSSGTMNIELLYANVLGHHFNFDAITFINSLGSGTYTYIYSSNTNNRARVTLSALSQISQDKHISCKDGFTVLYKEGVPLKTEIGIAPYENGVSNIANISGNLTQYEYYEEFDTLAEFLLPAFIKVPTSLVSYDTANTLFDSGGAAKALNVRTLPTKVNNYFFWDKINNTFKCHDKQSTKTWYLNLVGKNYLCAGDSEADMRYPHILSFKLGVNYTVNSKSGQTFQQMADAWESDLAATPTLLNGYKFITFIGGANDYGQGLTSALTSAGIDKLVTVLTGAMDADCKLMMLGMYNSVGAVQDPTTPNAGGQTFNSIRALVSAKANGTNILYSNMADAGITIADNCFVTPDTTHAYPVRAGVKMANQIITSLYTYKF